MVRPLLAPPFTSLFRAPVLTRCLRRFSVTIFNAPFVKGYVCSDRCLLRRLRRWHTSKGGQRVLDRTLLVSCGKQVHSAEEPEVDLAAVLLHAILHPADERDE